ncbi:MAG: SprB repeat-containing protein, partial [Lutibacter sp.]|nr:SprB repeat-containing protein [Lutibacter sp.]
MKKITLYSFLTFLGLLFSIITVNGQSVPTNFDAGAAVIDMGITPQTDNNALKPYGLVYELVTEGIPVNWIINPTKNFANANSDSSSSTTVIGGADLIVSGKTTRTGTVSTGTKTLTSGSFLIAAEYIAAAGSIIETWITNNPGLTVYWQLDAITNAPVIGVITNFPNVVVYSTDGSVSDIEEGFYQRAGIYNTSTATPFRYGMPEDITSCDQFYVLSHHSEPDKNWNQTQINQFYDFIIGGGNVWMGCRDVGITESVVQTSNAGGIREPYLNFLSTDGLIYYRDIDNSFDNKKVIYNTDNYVASDPIMQFKGEIHKALNGNSGRIFLPAIGSAWRASTTVGFYDPTQSDIPTNSPGEGAIVAYGPAYGNPDFGTILYQGSHIHKDNEGNNEDWVGEARLFGNFLLQSALETAPQISVSNLISPVCGNTDVVVSTNVTNAPFNNLSYSWASEIVSGPGAALSFTTANIASPTIGFPVVTGETVYKITLTVTDTPSGGCSNPITAKYFNTITVNATPIASAVKDNDVSCNGGTDGQATASATGGTSPY